MRRFLFLVWVLGGSTGCGESASDTRSANEPGCSTAPACGSCETCYESCVCQGASSASCIDQCASASGGAGGSSGAGTGGAGGSVATESVTIETSPRKLEPGEEAFFCQELSNPFGQDVEVVQSESFMTPGSHHMFVFYEPDAIDGPVHDCSGLEYKRTLHTAQTPQHLTKYPPGVGRFVEAGTGLKVLAHYLNTGSEVVNAKISVVFQVAPAGSVKAQAASLFFNNMAIAVPPKGPGTAQATCTLPYDVKVIDVVSHMHKWGVKFEAKASNGSVVYQGSDWNEPVPKVYDPPLELPAGTDITYTCSYQNTTPNTLTFGESAQANEMCILSGTYYPAPNGKSIICM